MQRVIMRRAGPPIATRQKTAFPPNYIHSLDSSHLKLTALRCGEEGVCSPGTCSCQLVPCRVVLREINAPSPGMCSCQLVPCRVVLREINAITMAGGWTCRHR